MTTGTAWASCLATLFLTVAGGSANQHPPSLDQPFQQSFEHLDHVPCVSLFSRKGRFGCGTVDREHMVGRLLNWTYMDFQDEHDHVAVMDEADFTVANIQMIQNEHLVGVLVLNSTSSNVFSPEPQTPQGQDTPSADLTIGNAYPWNIDGDGRGQGLTMADLYGIPIAFVKSVQVGEYLAEVATAQGKALLDSGEIFPHTVADFNYYMGPSTMDSPTCLGWIDTDGVWRPKCLPLGGTSVWATTPHDKDAERRRLEDVKKGGVVMLATSMDATSMFHDASSGSNTAASNILTLLLTAQLVGQMSQEDLKGLSKQIAFGFFQGESYGYIGSRTFFGDVYNFQCDEGGTVPAVAKQAGNSDQMACLHPLRPSLDFQNLGEIDGLIAIDQVGILSTEKTLYVHGSENDDDFAGFLSQVLLASGTDDFQVAESEVEAEDDEYPLPPTPLTSLIMKSGGAASGVILAGYNDAFVNGYHTHVRQEVNLDAISAAAVVLARSAVAAAYDGGDYDSETAVEYAAGAISDAMDSEILSELSQCLYVDGQCDLFRKFAEMERVTEREKTGLDLGVGESLGTPPNYYASVYQADYGQPFVVVDGKQYGSYTGDSYGKKDTDTFAMRPSALPMSIRGLLNHFLGGMDDDAVSCKSSNDCKNIADCAAVCTGGGVCVCSQAHYHMALDEGLEAAPNNSTGRFIVSESDEGISAMYTEPFWSMSVGVRVYRVAGTKAGNVTVGVGAVVAALCILCTLALKGRFKKEKVF